MATKEPSLRYTGGTQRRGIKLPTATIRAAERYRLTNSGRRTREAIVGSPVEEAPATNRYNAAGTREYQVQNLNYAGLQRMSSEVRDSDYPRYNFTNEEYSRLVTGYNSRRGWAYSDSDVVDMAKSYAGATDERTRAIIFERLEDANFHNDARKIINWANYVRRLPSRNYRATGLI